MVFKRQHKREKGKGKTPGMNKADALEKPLMIHQCEEEKNPSQRLHEANLKVTRPRLLVLSLLHEMNGHYSADEVVKMLQERQTPLPRASVYNALSALLNRGLVMSADVGPGRVLYEENIGWHHHFVCMDCNTVVDIACVKGVKPCLQPEWLPGTVEEAQIIFRGHCRSCLSKARESKSEGTGDAILNSV
jgi:Fur family ferric uptake transcriptional regulator